MDKTTGYRAEIDGLRALAIISVVLFHAGASAFPGGFVGVDVFFVISGYLITRLIYADACVGRFSLLNFYERRARRILPALFLMVICCVPLAWFLMLPSQMTKFAESMIAVATFVSNFVFWRQDGYFDEAAEFKPLLHTWSLAVEEQFYIFFPLFFRVVWKFGRRAVVLSIFLAVGISFALCEWAWRTAPVANFFLPPTRAWELLLGSLCALSVLQVRSWLGNFLATLGVALVILSVVGLGPQQPYPSAYTIIPVAGAMLIILFGQRGTVIAAALSSPLLVGIGLISYSTYLWHQPLFVFARLASPGELSLAARVGLTLASFGIGFLSWRYVEQPFRRSKSRWLSTRRSLFAASAAGMALIAMLGAWVASQQGFVSWVNAKPLANLELAGKDLNYAPCNATQLVKAKLNYCRLPNGKPDAALIGDSHAEDKFVGLDMEDRDRRWMLVANSSCPPVLNISVVADELACAEKMRIAINYLTKDPAIKTVVLAFSSSYPLTSPYAADHLKSHYGPDRAKISSQVYRGLSRQELFARGLQDAVGTLLSGGKRVIIFVDQPELPYFPLDCIRGAPNCNVDMSAVLKRQDLHRRQLVELKRRYPTIRVFDPLSTLCPSVTCSYRVGNSIVYRDSHHLTVAGSRIVARAFHKWDLATRSDQ